MSNTSTGSKPRRRQLLGTIEFSSILNGDEPSSGRAILERFVDTVRLERHIALSVDGRDGDVHTEDDNLNLYSIDEEECDRNDNNKNGDQRESKKRRLGHKDEEVDEWKKDSKGYNVPFVGTSANVGSTGTIRYGAWPTGFLREYALTGASELLSNDAIIPPKGLFFKSLSNSSATYKKLNITRLNVWCELVTCAVPVQTLKRLISLENEFLVKQNQDIQNYNISNRNGDDCDSFVDNGDNVTKSNNMDTKFESIISSFMKEKFVTLLELIDEECKCTQQSGQNHAGKQSEHKIQNEAGKNTKLGKDGRPVVAAALGIIATLSSISYGVAREITREIHGNLTDNSLKTCFRSFVTNNTKNNNKGNASNKSEHKNISHDNGNVDNLICKTSRSCSTLMNPSTNYVHKTEFRNITEARTAAIHLTSALLESRDPFTIPIACNSVSSGEKRTRPGILYYALCNGLSHPIFNEELSISENQINESSDISKHLDQYLFATFRLLRAIRMLLCTKSSKNVLIDNGENNTYHSRNILHHKIFCDLLSGEAMERLTKIACLTPSHLRTLKEEKWYDVENGNEYFSHEGYRTTFEQNEDSSRTVGSLEKVAYEAWKLVMIILMDSNKSPFLITLRSHKRREHLNTSKFNNASSSNYKANIIGPNCLRQLSTCLNKIFLDHEIGSRGKYGIFARKLVSKCLHNTPELVSYHFRSVTLGSIGLEANVNNHRKGSSGSNESSYRLLLFLGYIRALIQDAPPIMDCMQATNNINTQLDKNDSVKDESERLIFDNKCERVIRYIMPPCITKQFLSKVIQKKDPIVVSQCLMLISAVIKRVGFFPNNRSTPDTSEMTKSVQVSKYGENEYRKEHYTQKIAEMMVKRLPDLQVMLAIRSRFDLHSIEKNELEENSESNKEQSKTTPLFSNSIVCMNLCDVLILYSEIFPKALLSVPFDWIKLLSSPDTGKNTIVHIQESGGNGINCADNVVGTGFFNAPLCLQYRLLRTLLAVASISSSSKDEVLRGTFYLSQNALSNVLHIMLGTKSESIHSIARTIALTLIKDVISQYHSEDSCLEYEASLWVDALTSANVSTLCKLVDAASKAKIEHLLLSYESIGKTVHDREDSTLEVQYSSLLSTALLHIASSLTSRTVDVSFIMYVCQITIKLMLFYVSQDSIFSLASFVSYVFRRFYDADEYKKWFQSHQEENDDVKFIKPIQLLLNCTKDIIRKNQRNTSENMTEYLTMQIKLCKLCEFLFGRNSFHTHIASRTSISSHFNTNNFVVIPNEMCFNPGLNFEVAFIAFRQCYQNMKTFMYNGNDFLMKKCYQESLLLILMHNRKEPIINEKIFLRSFTCVKREQPMSKNNVLSFLSTLSYFVSTSIYPNIESRSEETILTFINMFYVPQIEGMILNKDLDLEKIRMFTLLISASLHITTPKETQALLRLTISKYDFSKKATNEYDMHFLTILHLLLLKILYAIPNDLFIEEKFLKSGKIDCADSSLEIFPAKELFYIWKDLIENQNYFCKDKSLHANNKNIPITIQLCIEIERIMSSILINSEKSGLLHTVLFSEVCSNNGPQHIIYLYYLNRSSHVMKALHNRVLTSNNHHDKCSEREKINFVVALLKYDPPLFAPYVLSHISTSVGEKIESILLETIFALAQVYVRKFPDDYVHQSSTMGHLKDVVRITMNYTSSLLDENMEQRDADSISSFEFVFGALKIFLNQDLNHHCNLESLSLKISKYFENSVLLRSSRSHSGSKNKVPPLCSAEENYVLEFLFGLISNVNEKQKKLSTMEEAFSSALVFMCKILPKYLKRIQLQNRSKNTTAMTVLRVQMYLNFVISILEKFSIVFESTRVLQNNVVLKNFIVACLKHGIHNSNSCIIKNSIPALCLKLVRLILTHISAPAWHPGNSYSSNLSILSENLFLPYQVHEMIISHSEFQSLVNSKADESQFSTKVDGVGARYELFALLVCCISLALLRKSTDCPNGGSSDMIRLDKSTLRTLFQSYGEGMSSEDRLLRRLFYLYESCISTLRMSQGRKDIVAPSRPTVEIQWSDLLDMFEDHKLLEKEKNHNHYDNWEWYVEAFDLQRVRITLSKFPLWETLTPSAHQSIEPWEPSSNQNNRPLNDLPSQDYQFMDENDSNLHKIRSTENSYFFLNNSLSDSSNTSCAVKDKIYCPAFSMSLLFQVLDHYAPDSLFQNIKSNQEFSQSPSIESEVDQHVSNCSIRREKFCNITCRLGQKGAISLSLACLACKCPKLRQAAISVLTLFLYALQMDESKNIESWKERPQIAMILNSVQRGLVLVRSHQKNSSDNQISKCNESSTHTFLIPMFPAVSALFLARASLILMKPGDEMYSTINKFFLRLEHHHGAYMDCSSLPAFISLFCSSDIDEIQAQRERLWMLQLLRDGALDSFSYRSISRRHAPELILSSFASLSSRRKTNGDHYECVLLLESIQTMIKYGGKSSFHHLISAVGLIAWIQGVLENGYFKTILPGLLERYKFLNILHTSLLKLGKEDYETYFQSTIHLAQPVLDMILHTLQQSQRSDTKNFLIQDIHILASECLWLLSKITQFTKKGIGVDANLVVNNPIGIQLDSASSFLDESKARPFLLPKIVDAMSVLPLYAGLNDGTAALNLCEKLLFFLIENDFSKKKDLSLVCNIFLRITEMATAYKEHVALNDKLVQMVLCTKRKGLLCSDGAHLWFKCISLFLEIRPKSDNKTTRLLNALKTISVSHNVT
mmetsp:Transcript_14722/g.21022  ORF Transcript_14722/g.21022 Transcript_14722/m.21022 type:complete len:2722 (-) Transcript_14722:185-8350(-)